MKWEAIVMRQSGGSRKARLLGCPHPTEAEAVAWATHYMELAVAQMHRNRIDGKPHHLPWGYNGKRTAYQHDDRCKHGIRTPPNCTLST